MTSLVQHLMLSGYSGKWISIKVINMLKHVKHYHGCDIVLLSWVLSLETIIGKSGKIYLQSIFNMPL